MRFSAKAGLALLAITLLVLPGTAGAQPEEPASVARAESGPVGLWTLQSKHLIWGMPRQTDNRHNIRFAGESGARTGLSVLVREGFVIGHYDLYKVPAWVSVRWNREDFESLLDGSFGRDFGPDAELPRYARAERNYDFATSKMERGHMARHEDNEAWGEDNSDAGCLMSNIVPQHKDMNGEAWNDLEELHQRVVANPSYGIDTIWIISGPIFEDADGDGDEDPLDMIGNDVAVPQATYKVIGWFNGSNTFQARGYVVRQEDRVRHNPAHYLARIDEIEAATGLDFFPDLPQAQAHSIESIQHTNIWGLTADEEGDEEEVGESAVRIASILPNPVGDESENEAVSVRNRGTTAVSLEGWRVRDERGWTWSLFGTLDPGDERTFTRNGQGMALNNDGDTVELLDSNGTVIDAVTYAKSQEQELIDAENLR